MTYQFCLANQLLKVGRSEGESHSPPYRSIYTCWCQKTIGLAAEGSYARLTANLNSRLLELMIMSVLGVPVGGLLIAMYLPIFQLGKVV